MDRENKISPHQSDIYQHIYEHAKKEYRNIRFRNLLQRTFFFMITGLSFAGIFFILFYVFFIRNHVQSLEDQIQLYSQKVQNLSSEVEKLYTAEEEYLNQLKAYREAMGKLKIEENEVVDFDLTEKVEKTVNNIANPGTKYINIYRGNKAFPETALTFDLGTGEELPFVYTVLKRFGVKATIFISNEMSSTEYGSLFKQRNIEYLIKMGELGCEFGNHTWSHYNLKRSLYETSKKARLNLTFISDEVIDEVGIKMELERTSRFFYQKTGYRISPYWRAPYGAIDKRILSLAASAGYPYHVFWSANSKGPLDFYDYVTKRFIWVNDKNTGKYTRQRNPLFYTSQEMLLRLKEWEKADAHGLNGAISICHLGTSRKMDKIINILPEYIDYFQNKGYRFVRISELMNNRLD